MAEQITGACRFCGQSIILQNGENMTEPQREECATRKCECEEAVAYTAAAEREGKAIERVNELFGEGSGTARQSEAVLKELEEAVKLVNKKEVKEVTIVIRTGFKATIKAMAKDKIKVSRQQSNIEAFEQ